MPTRTDAAGPARLAGLALRHPGLRGLVIGLSLLAGHGCGEPTDEMASGPAGPVPEEVAPYLPDGATLCHGEAKHDGDYQLWVYRAEKGTWIAFPDPKAKGAGRGKAKPRLPDFEQHSMPPSALESILRSKVPSLDSGRPVEPRCRYTHWRGKDGAELQIRELVTDQGWFASVERVRL